MGRAVRRACPSSDVHCTRRRAHAHHRAPGARAASLECEEHTLTPRQSASGSAESRAPWFAAALTVLLLLVLAYAALVVRTRVLFEGESQFGRVRVTERADGLRSLYIGAGRAIQTSLYPGRPLQLVAPYTQVAMIGPAFAAPGGRILFVGLGGGAMPTWTRQALPDAVIDVVEIDPLVIDVATSYFGFRPDDRLRVHAGDGRAYIEGAAPATWEVIVLAAFSDDEVPFALTTSEFLVSVRSRLAAEGVVVSNLWTASPAYASMLATYSAVFDQVALIRVTGRPQVILVAAAAARPLDKSALLQAARRLPQQDAAGFDLSALVAAGYDTLPAQQRAPVLHDERSGS
jgi:spermidine synthase